MGKADRPEIAPLTAMRGIAALAVVIYHFSGGFLPNLDLTSVTGLVSKGYLWVDFFFVLSGFILSHAYADTFREGVGWPSFRAFIEARFARIYPLHLTVLGGFLLLEFAKTALLGLHLGQEVAEPFGAGESPYGLVLNVLLLQTTGLQPHPTWNGPAWSIGAEFAAYLLFPLLTLLVIRMGGSTRLALGAAALTGLWLISDYGTDLDHTTSFGLLRCLFEFTLGILTYQLFQRLPKALLARNAPPVLLGAGILAALHFELPDVVIPPAFALFILFIAANRGATARVLSAAPLVHIGTISYSIYMSHYLLIEAIQLVSRAVTGAGAGRHLDARLSSLLLAFLVLGVILASGRIYRLVEEPARGRVRRWLSGIGRKPSNPAALTRASRPRRFGVGLRRGR